MKYADLTSSTSHVEISAILQNKCPTLTHIIYTVQEVLCKMFETLLSYAQFIRGGVHRSARFARHCFSYFTPFFALFRPAEPVPGYTQPQFNYSNLNTLKTLFGLSRVLLDLQKCILSSAIKLVSVVCVRSSKGNLSLFEITPSVLLSRKFTCNLTRVF